MRYGQRYRYEYLNVDCLPRCCLYYISGCYVLCRLQTISYARCTSSEKTCKWWMFYWNMWSKINNNSLFTLITFLLYYILYNIIHTMYSLVSVPYYDHLTQCYKKVIKISPPPPPNSPLNAIVKRVGPIRLSPFQVDSTFSGCGGGDGGCCSNLAQCCNLLITSVHDKHHIMCVDEIPTLFQFLIMNGFKIDTSITKMMQASNVKLSNDLICFFS